MTLNRPGDLWQNLISPATLDAAWARVRANNGAAGGDRVTIGRFQISAAKDLAHLARALDSGRWRPLPHRHVDIPKRKGGSRRLTIPSIADRVLHTALAQVLTPILDPMFEEGSYAYRPGRSVQQAVREIDRLRKAGYWHVIEADIVGFFDNVRHDLALAKLEAALSRHPGGARIVALVGHILEHQSQESGDHGRGLAQGSPLSPLLANLYLHDLDEAIEGQGIRIIRFADDFVVLCRRRESAVAAFHDVRRILSDHGLELHGEGTRVLDFDRGFEFLGTLFLRSLVLQRVADPEEDAVELLRQIGAEDEKDVRQLTEDLRGGYDRGARVLYLSERGRHLSLRNASFSVRGADGGELAAIAHHRVDRIEIGPGTGADWQAVDHALATDTDLAIVDGRGETRGLLSRPEVDHGGRQLAQAALVLDPARSTGIARLLVEARIRNMRTQLFRSNRDNRDPEVTASLSRMQRHLRKLPEAASVASLRGIEGAAAAEYWPMLARLTEEARRDFTRDRPATDPLNAALNYLSALLERDVRAAVVAAGLHPGFSILHATRDRADPCVWDMMEPFRTPLTEAVASYLFNARRLRPEMFSPMDKGIRIDPAGRRALIKGYESAVARQVNAPGRKGKLAWRPMMRRQALDLAKAAEAGDPALFRPYQMEA